MTSPIKPIKKLGQHFLTNDIIASNIVRSLDPGDLKYDSLVEIGPGTGILTQYLINLELKKFFAIEIDKRSIIYLQEKYPSFSDKFIESDFLTNDLSFLNKEQFGIIGNFPYNISSQILFKLYENWEQIPELVGMFQDELAKRICSPPGNKNYGILSVLLQAYYTTEYLFQVTPEHFTPPPKVNSGVIRLRRKSDAGPNCDPKKFKMIVKTAFNHRRKILKNSLKSLIPHELDDFPYSNKRPEQLFYTQFAEIVNTIYP